MDKRSKERLVAADAASMYEGATVKQDDVVSQVLRAKKKIEKYVGYELTYISPDHYKDGSLFCSLELLASLPSIRDKGDTKTVSVCSVLVSGFGNLFVVQAQDGLFQDEQLTEINRLMVKAGFKHIPNKALDEIYDGANVALPGITWRERYFTDCW